MRQAVAFLAVLSMAPTTYAAQPTAPAPLTTIRGVVTAATRNTVTLVRAITIDISAARITKRNAPALDGLVPGARVRVTIAAPKSSGTLIADSVLIESPDATITASIEAITSSSITIAGQSLPLAGDAAYGGFAAGVAVRAPADLKVGMPVVVDIVTTNAGLLATRVVAVGPVPPPPPGPQAAQTSITGPVTQITANAWTVGSTKIYVSPRTAILGRPAVGNQVVVSGVRTPEGALIAKAIAKQ